MMHQARQNSESVVATAVSLANGMLDLIGDHSTLKGRGGRYRARANADPPHTARKPINERDQNSRARAYKCAF